MSVTVEALMEAGFDRAQAEFEVRRIQLAEELRAADPSLGITATIIAGDRVSAEYATREVEQGAEPEAVLWSIGSYARFGWAVDHLPRPRLYELLPDLWPAADPDDTDPRFLAVWREAWEWNGRQPLYDDDVGGGTLSGERIRVWRGQDDGADVGISWTTDRDIAVKFARGAGLRQGNRAGIVLLGVVDRSDVLAYLTGRGESEVILDPRSVTLVAGSTLLDGQRRLR